MTVVAAAAGVVWSLPIRLGTARNLAPLPVYLVCRAVVAVSRSFQDVIVAILFVVMVGFGPLSGVLTLAFASVGFLGMLLAEKIEAIRSTGASWSQNLRSLELSPRGLGAFEAKTHLSKLLERVRQGDRVVITVAAFPWRSSSRRERWSGVS